MARTTGSTSFLQFTIRQLQAMGFAEDEPIHVSRVKLEDRAKKNFKLAFPALVPEVKPVEEVQVTEFSFDDENTENNSTNPQS